MAQPSSRDIDAFRLQFFQSLIQDETTKAAEIKRKQRMCFHAFHQVAPKEWECRRCGMTRKKG